MLIPLMLFLLTYQIDLFPHPAITYAKWESRLGDHLVQYIKAKWLAKKHHLEFLHKRFPYDEQLELFYQEKQLNQYKHEYSQTIVIRDAEPTYFADNTLYEMEYIIPLKDSWQTILSDTVFMEEIKKMIKPHFKILWFDLPPDMLTVAIHIRKGGGYDIPISSDQFYNTNKLQPTKRLKGIFADQVYPLKFLPNQYYINQLKEIAELFGNTPLYVHIFTDDANPEKFADMFKEHINKNNINYGFRKVDNFHNKHVVEDFFNMAFKFDCLIRGGSNFSTIADLIGNHKLIIRPMKATWENNALIVTKIAYVATDDFFKLLKNNSDDFIETFFTT